MDRRRFIRSLFASTATIVVAPEIAIDVLDEMSHLRKKTYFDVKPHWTTLIDSSDFPEPGVFYILKNSDLWSLGQVMS